MQCRRRVGQNGGRTKAFLVSCILAACHTYTCKYVCMSWRVFFAFKAFSRSFLHFNSVHSFTRIYFCSVFLAVLLFIIVIRNCFSTNDSANRYTFSLARSVVCRFCATRLSYSTDLDAVWPVGSKEPMCNVEVLIFYGKRRFRVE